MITTSEALLYIVATPIGNLGDISPRALSVLKEVDYILCEDTRVTKKLLSHFNINVPLIAYHTFNEEKKTEEVLALLENNYKLALVSDAGTPLISDPGFPLVKRAIERNYKIISIPGPNAAISALVASGMPIEKYLFYGFLSSRVNKRRQELLALRDFPYTIVFYEAPHRIQDTLFDIEELLGNREAVIARELTKVFEEYIRGTVADLQNYNYKGELVIVLAGANNSYAIKKLNDLSIVEHFSYYLKEGYQKMTAIKEVAKDRKISKGEVYKIIEETKKD